jgi:hypothetical protein
MARRYQLTATGYDAFNADGSLLVSVPYDPEQQGFTPFADAAAATAHAEAYLAALDAPPAPPTPATLQEAQELKAAELVAACDAEQFGGITSSAAGSPHFYTSDARDQSLLTAAVVIGKDRSWVVRDTPGGAPYGLEHTLAQLRTLGEDIGTLVDTAIGKKYYLLAQVAAATTIEEVAAIGW